MSDDPIPTRKPIVAGTGTSFGVHADLVPIGPGVTARNPYGLVGVDVTATGLLPAHRPSFGSFPNALTAAGTLQTLSGHDHIVTRFANETAKTATIAAQIGGLFTREKEEAELKNKIESLLKENGALLEAHKKTREDADKLRELAAQHSADLKTQKQLEAKLTQLQDQRSAADKKYDELNKQVKILKFSRHLMREDAITALKKEGDLAEAFSTNSTTQAYVMSVDIRRSTELMLKAKSPDSFADFISELCQELKSSVAKHYGVVDKFTGDGILAYFPTFYSGPHAGLHCLSAAEECHRNFQDIYRRHHRGFDSVLLDVGLGIGVDFGYIKIVHMGDELSIVGKPVVYACRLGSAPAGVTLANNGAIEALALTHAGQYNAHEATLDIKNEGRVLTYKVQVNQGIQTPDDPGWKLAIEATSAPTTAVSSADPPATTPQPASPL